MNELQIFNFESNDVRLLQTETETGLLLPMFVQY